MDEKTALTVVACITKIPVRKLRLCCMVAGSMNHLLRNAHTVDGPLTERQRDVLSSLCDLARYIMQEGGLPT